ncbi:hypothetical protein HGG64_02340 [Mycoplasma phocoeninasale]|uniref:SGNH hydrolase-type esterase domain-containing protein n=1 Tax=Mycoplasma phocoeninasale TaxID=2726117 RepID=A0A858U3A5_9MOLU|nr:SGNH/GDSL hydrolase family protein [Mycoplasma phocoeninasale]QJG66529.1 hypothetical protein HGG64_02340 [Mycoplasma phocoeninasale]
MKKIIKIGFLALTSIVPMSIVAASCTTAKANNKTFDSAIDSNGFLNKNLNIVALGDSITAGFNSEYSFELPGNFENSEGAKVKGLSYPSFFVDLLQKIKPNFVKHYENFALSSSKITDWLYLLQTPNFNYDPNVKGSVFKFLKNIDKEDKNPFKDRIKKQFGDFSPNSLGNLISQVKNAHFITLSAGANDLFKNLNFTLIQKIFQNPSEENVNEFNSSLIQTFQNIETNFDMLIKRIKTLNKNARVSIVGYPFILLRAKPFIDELFRGTDIPFKVFEKLNDIAKKVAKDNKVIYVETYDEKYWLDNAKSLAHSIFDIHPTEEGYKKIAMELLRKLAFNYKDPQEINVNQNQKYSEKDKVSIHKIFETNKTNEELKKIVERFESEKTSYQAEINSKKDELFSIQSNIINNWIAANKAAIKANLGKFFADNQNLKNLFNQDSFIDKIISAIQKSKLIDKTVINLHKYFDQTNLPINKTNLITFFLNQELIFILAKEFISIDFNTEEKVAISKGIAMLLNKIDLINPQLSSLKNNSVILRFIEDTILDVLNNKQLYGNANDFADLISIYLKNHPNIDFKELVKSILSNDFILEKIFEQIESRYPVLKENKKVIKAIITNITRFSIFDKFQKYIINKLISKQINFSEPSLKDFSDINIEGLDFLTLLSEINKIPDSDPIKKDFDGVYGIISNILSKSNKLQPKTS